MTRILIVAAAVVAGFVLPQLFGESALFGAVGVGLFAGMVLASRTSGFK